MAIWNENKLSHLYLIQIDLANHSKWVSALNSDPEATSSRAEFAQELMNKLCNYHFKRAFWAGDGGVFCSDDKNEITNLIEAINAIYELFDYWKSKKDDRKILSIRITVHTDQIYTHKEPGYWYSDSYNTFLKYERDFGIAGSAVITDQIWRRMNKQQQERWIKYSAQKINGVLWQLYRDRDRLQEITTQTFVHWLIDSKYNVPGQYAKLFNEGNILAKCFETIIIAKPLTSEGFKNNIDLIEEQFDNSKWAIDQNQLIHSPKKNDFRKLSLTSIAKPMTDNKTLRLYYTIINYSFGSAFHRYVEEKEDKWNELKQYANCTSKLSKNVPSIFVGHNSLVVIDQNTLKEYVVLCQRVVNPKQLDYYSGSWSISFEEQFKPIKFGEEERDNSPKECIIRGLQEEFNYDGKYEDIQIQSIFVEARNLNIAFLGYVKIKTNIELFKSNLLKANDETEFESILLIERNKNNLEKCINSDSVPEDLFNEAIFLKNKRENINILLWHPTSKLRLANLIWEHEI